jgi:hypothetical protein
MTARRSEVGHSIRFEVGERLSAATARGGHGKHDRRCRAVGCRAIVRPGSHCGRAHVPEFGAESRDRTRSRKLSIRASCRARKL